MPYFLPPVFKAEPVNSSDVAAISFPEELDTVRFGAVQSTLSQEFLLERGAQGIYIIIHLHTAL